jgi:hypothetical protein
VILRAFKLSETLMSFLRIISRFNHFKKVNNKTVRYTFIFPPRSFDIFRSNRVRIKRNGIGPKIESKAYF